MSYVCFWQKRPPMHAYKHRFFADKYCQLGRWWKSLTWRRISARVNLRGSKGNRLP